MMKLINFVHHDEIWILMKKDCWFKRELKILQLLLTYTDLLTHIFLVHLTVSIIRDITIMLKSITGVVVLVQSWVILSKWPLEDADFWLVSDLSRGCWCWRSDLQEDHQGDLLDWRGSEARLLQRWSELDWMMLVQILQQCQSHVHHSQVEPLWSYCNWN